MNVSNFTNIKLATSLDENINKIKGIFVNDATVVYRKLTLGRPTSIECILIYIDGMAGSELINENIIKPLLLSDISTIKTSTIIDILMQKVLLTGDNKKNILCG